MTEAIVNRCTTAVRNRLAAISLQANYRFDAVVEAAQRTGHRSRAGLLIIRAVGLPRDREDAPLGKDSYDQDYEVDYDFPISTTDTDNTADALLQMVFAECRRAVMIDHQHAGLAMTTHSWGGEIGGAANGSNTGVVRFTVWYRTALDDPFSL